mmetsp:Transcript_10209/g.28111  ORF Transcript_10209/g.28111 Transcript_10209/m.28111 type:complete len:847 (+) Transcript_10209:84-2624(+)
MTLASLLRRRAATPLLQSFSFPRSVNKVNNPSKVLLQPVPATGSSTSANRPFSSWYFGKKEYGAFHFATTEYASCFVNLPQPDPNYFYQAATNYLEQDFDAQLWHDDPMVSLVNGKPLLQDGEKVDTTNALGQVNGKQILASPKQVQLLKEHIQSIRSNHNDLRDVVRHIEQELFTHHSGALVGNQCVDFGKQDGMTELEEAIMANVVERRLNDLLLLEEKRNIIDINRQPIYVSCVSNFTNFLDLSRKVLRSLEVGVPVIVLGRSHTSQHAYRWTKLLQQLCQEHAAQLQGTTDAATVDPSMITFLSCSLDDMKEILRDCQDATGNLYTTCSRDLAAEIKKNYPKTIASTGGPNTMVIATPAKDNPTEVILDPDEGTAYDSQQLQEGQANESTATDETAVEENDKAEETKKRKEWFTMHMKAAIRTSAAIESAGQCTALRHVIVPTEFEADQHLEDILMQVQTIDSPVLALQNKLFDGVYLHQATPGPSTAEYTHNTESDTYWKLNDELPAQGSQLPEYWRKVVVDFTPLDTSSYDNLDKLATWLNQHQPISLAVNGNMVDSYKVLRRLFDRTSLLVYTVGGRDDEKIPTNPWPKHLPPALSCQARPQECEIFGEVPPRFELHKYTQFPVLIPSSNPSYDAWYELDYLQKVAAPDASWSKASLALMNAIKSDAIRGYVCLLTHYIRNIDDENPKEVSVTSKGRTVLWGLQRPPLQTTTIVRTTSTNWDAVAPIVILFHITNARDQVQVSVTPENTPMKEFCDKHSLKCQVESEAELEQRVQADQAGNGEVFQVVYANESMTKFPMVGQFTSLYFCTGHVKSTAASDQEFLVRFKSVSKKWIRSLF